MRGIHAVAAGEAIFAPGVARRVLGLVAGPHRSGEPFPELTARERQVLELLAAGRTTTAAGARLGLAPKTVTNHASAVFAELGVSGRAEAVARARRAGLGGGGGDQPVRRSTAAATRSSEAVRATRTCSAPAGP